MSINLLRNLLNLITKRIRNLCRTNLAAVAIVLGLVIEELVLGNDLDNRQSHILMTIEIYGTCELAADNRTLCHNGISFGKSSINCSIEILNPLHLGNTETAAAICRFHKHRQSQTFYSLPGKSLY